MFQEVQKILVTELSTEIALMAFKKSKSKTVIF